VTRRVLWTILCLALFAPSRVLCEPSLSAPASPRLSLPIGWVFVSDTAYALDVVENPSPWRSLSSLAAFQPRWVTGLSGLGVGLLFDGIACPLPSLSSRFGAGGLGAVEFLGFPAGAWWGPSAGSGAIQLRAPRPNEEDRHHLSTAAWGSRHDFGAALGWTGRSHAASASWSRWKDAAGDWGHRLARSSSLKLGLGDAFSVGLSSLVEDVRGGDWMVWHASTDWTSGNFQTVRLAPYVQRARLDGRSVEEGGAQVDHHLNLAGLIETHVGAGGAARGWKGSEGKGATRFGYLRGGVLGDVLGMANLDASFRWDGAQGAHAKPSVMGGLRVPLGAFRLEASLARSARSGASPGEILGEGRVAENAFGLGLQPLRRVEVFGRYARRSEGMVRWEAWEPGLRWRGLIGPWGLIQTMDLMATGILSAGREGWVSPPDAVTGRLDVVLKGGWGMWAGLRSEERVQVRALAGVRLQRGGSTFRLELEDVGQGDLAWPDPSSAPGQELRCSWEGSF